MVRRKLRELLAVVLLALASASVLVGANAQPAAAQGGPDVHDWGWVQGYYGGVHIFMHDYCPYTSNKTDCRHFATEHHIVSTGQVLFEVQYLPEWVWPYSIAAGSLGGSPITIIWSVLGTPWYNTGGGVAWGQIDNSCPPPSQTDTCGVFQNGVATVAGYSPAMLGGNTRHNRYLQVLAITQQLALSDGWYHWVAPMYLY